MRRFLISFVFFFVCLFSFAQTQYVISGEVTYSGEVHGHSKVTIDSRYVTADWDDNGIKHHKRFQYSSYSASVDALSLEIISSTNKDDNLFCFNGTLGFTCDNEFHLSVFKENDETFIRLLSAAYNRTGIFAQFKLATKDHEYIDLGLSVLWATCNVGATKPEEYGDYFAWGETTPKSEYWWGNLKYRIAGDEFDNIKLSKYVVSSTYGQVDNITRLEMSDDAARVNWGGKWHMPTEADFRELIDKCVWTWTTLNGTAGYKVVSKINGNSIFLPAAGCRGGKNLNNDGQGGGYWSNSLLEGSQFPAAMQLFFNSNDHGTSPSSRSNGLTVRAVCP